MATYYNRYDRSKGWKSLRFMPGRVVQLPELNEMQSVLHDNHKELGDILFKDGSIVAGLQLIKHPTDETKRIIEPGKLYAYGYIIDVPEGLVTIQGLVQEKIGIKLTETIVDELSDATLNDPVTGAKNKGNPGAHRLTYVPSFVVDEDTDDVFVLHVLEFGELITNNIPPQFDELNQTLAKRTYEESGSYLVSGLETTVTDSSLDHILHYRSTQLSDLALSVGLQRATNEDDASLAARIQEHTQTVNVDAGLAYIEGFRVEKVSPTKILVPKSRAEKFVNNEFQQMPSSHSAGAVVQVVLNDGPVSRLVQGEVTVPVRKVYPNVVRNPLVGTDSIAAPGPLMGPPVSIKYTHTNLETYTYALGTHYTFGNNTITWLNPDSANYDPGVASPVACVPRGSEYQVTVDYTATLTVGENASSDVYLQDSKLRTVVFTGKINGVNVQYTPNGFASIDYHWFLNRADLIYMDRNGHVEVLLGQPDRSPVVKGTPKGSLALAKMILQADTDALNTGVTDLKVKRLTMAEINDLVRRMERNEYNQAITNLNVTARLGVANNVDLKGIFTDPFANADKIDASSTEYQDDPCAFNFSEGYITTGQTSFKATALTVNVAGSTNAMVTPTFLTGTTDTDYNVDRMKQVDATSTVQVNMYGAFRMLPSATLTPNQDIATADATTIQLPNTITGSTISLPSRGLDPAQVQKRIDDATQRITVGASPRYIPSREVVVNATGFEPHDDNLALTIDGIACDVEPVADSTTTVGTSTFNSMKTVKADAAGKVSCRFTIPANRILAGVRDVKLFNGTRAATTTFTADNPLVTQQLVVKPNVSWYSVDPVAQTFRFTEQHGGPALIAGVRLYFATKPSTNNETDRVGIQIRRTIAGMPEAYKSLAHKDLLPSQVNVSADGSAYTDVIFDNPVSCEQDVEYAVVILSESTQYRLYKATLGEKTLGASPRVVSTQTHTGVLLTSANAATWTPDQLSDLKFNMLTIRPRANVVIKFNDVTFPESVTKLQLLAIHEEVKGSPIVWQYSTDNFASVIGTLDPTGTVIELRSAATTVQLRAVITNTPGVGAYSMIHKDSLKLYGIRNESKGIYISKPITLQQAPTNIKIQVDAKVPAGTSFVTEYGLQTLQGDLVWYRDMEQLGDGLITDDPGFVTYTFNSPALSTSKTVVKLRLTMNALVSGEDILAAPKIRRLVSIIS